VVPNANIAVNQEKKPMFLFNPGAALNDIVRAVNQVGASPAIWSLFWKRSKRPAPLKPNSS
jgi:flagellar basal body P-ring protein FlgI